jgi:hypothetical protein
MCFRNEWINNIINNSNYTLLSSLLFLLKLLLFNTFYLLINNQVQTIPLLPKSSDSLNSSRIYNFFLFLFGSDFKVSDESPVLELDFFMWYFLYLCLLPLACCLRTGNCFFTSKDSHWSAMGQRRCTFLIILLLLFCTSIQAWYTICAKTWVPLKH